jgi:hypothetical protein
MIPYINHYSYIIIIIVIIYIYINNAIYQPYSSSPFSHLAMRSPWRSLRTRCPSPVAPPPPHAPCRRRPTAGHEPRRGDGGAGIPWDKNGDFGEKIVDSSRNGEYLVIL